MFVRNILSAIIISLAPISMASTALAAGGDTPPIPTQDWSFSGAFGTYDKAALQRGYKIYREVCASCHSMKYVRFRNLDALGYSQDQIKAIAAQYSVMDGPDEEGEMFERAAIPSDAFISPFPNENAAKSANGGAYPPDLSLITKARANGSNYVHALLTGYKDNLPHGQILSDGQYWNTYFPGNKLAMAPPLSDGSVSYEDDNTLETLDQYAKDISHFLTWAADPYMEERKRTGFKVLLFLILFAGVMYGVKRRIWSDLH